MKIIEGSVKMLELTDEEYFGNALPGHISNSKMSLINPAQGGSPQKYQSGFSEKKTDALTLGSAIHALLLEDELYRLAEITAPTDTLRVIMDTAYKLMKRDKNSLSYDEAVEFAVQFHNYYGGKPGAKRIEKLKLDTAEYFNFISHNNDPYLIYLTAEMKSKAVQSIAAIKANREAMDLLKPLDRTLISLNEKVLVAKIEFGEYIYDMKLKLDNALIDVDNKSAKLNDLKTTGMDLHTFMGQTVLALEDATSNEPVPHNKWSLNLSYKFQPGSFQKYHYYRQMYMYREIFSHYVKQTYDIDMENIETNMVVVETKDYKPRAGVFNVSEDWMDKGNKEFNYLMGLIDYYETNGYGNNIELQSDLMDDLILDDSAFI